MSAPLRAASLTSIGPHTASPDKMLRTRSFATLSSSDHVSIGHTWTYTWTSQKPCGLSWCPLQRNQWEGALHWTCLFTHSCFPASNAVRGFQKRYDFMRRVCEGCRSGTYCQQRTDLSARHATERRITMTGCPDPQRPLITVALSCWKVLCNASSIRVSKRWSSLQRHSNDWNQFWRCLQWISSDEIDSGVSATNFNWSKRMREMPVPNLNVLKWS